MNLRILKKLSKRAEPLLRQICRRPQLFRAERDGNFTSTRIRARKHQDRTRLSREPINLRDGSTAHRTRDGSAWILMCEPYQPRKGTVMIGAMSGGEEPEWDECTAWDELRDIVWTHYTDWSGETPTVTRRLRIPSDVLRAAENMVAELAQEGQGNG